ncbi:hypothetical protein CPE01_24450 [Cellulomonas persica]|uniref:PKD domain-containing protein n=1 Tax=Cellulomonas persica TaxID=76861 RepID=A0A510UVK0_9CELL|nr:hypothetical protein CPE01_24450 [Cellulomonas persica]
MVRDDSDERLTVRSNRAAFAVVLAWLLVALVPSPVTASIGGEIDESDIRLRAVDATDGLARYRSNPDAGEYEWKRDLPCWSRFPEIDRTSNEVCWGGSAIQHDPPVCEDGAALQPIWRRLRSDVTWWKQVGWHCPEHLLPEMTEEDFRLLSIAPAPAHMQPTGGEVLVNKPTIVFTEGGVQTFRTDLLGYGIDVEATPLTFTWDFGDGARPLVTAELGRPYPDFDLARTYTTPTRTHITLTATWTGRYRVDIDPLHKWRDIDGTAFTTASTPDFEVVELRSRLVTP